ncbi:PA14 domain-containing protein, partial [Salinibacterium sp.]|uniref:PA14 domain-containing protein n=1 Tax=Salinibacterium sp. TaxID=1915057 RepID=UPI00286B7BC8
MHRSTLFRATLSIALSAILIGTLVTPVTASETQPAPATVPPLTSPPIVIPPSTVPAGDFTNIEAPVSGSVSKRIGGTRPTPAAILPAPKVSAQAAFDETTAAITKMSEYTTVYANPDGTRTTKIGNEPLNAKNDAGTWVPVETTLTQDAGSNWTTDAHPLDPTFAKSADAAGAFSISRDGYDIRFTLEGAAPSPVSRNAHPRQQTFGDKLQYDEVFPNIDVKYQVNRVGVKEALVLSKPPSLKDSTWIWHVDANALTLAIDEFGVINFTDRYGIVKFHIPAPVMWDSSGVPGKSEAPMINVGTRVVRDGAGWKITLSANNRWLTDPARVYPVTVDPTIGAGPASINAYKSDGAYRNDSILVGDSQSAGATPWRSVVRYDYPGTAGQQVTNASMHIAYAGDGYTGWAAGNVYTANCFGFACNGDYLNSYSIATGDTWPNTPQLVARFASLVAQGQYSWHVLITGTEGGGYTYKSIYADLFIITKDFPAVTSVDSPSPADGAVKSTMMPSFKVTGSDPAATGLAYQYKVGTTPNVAASMIYTSPWSTTAQQQVPQNALQPGVKYYWQGFVKDGYDGYLGTSTVRGGPIRSFTTNVPAPAASQAATTPTDGQTITTLTPTMQTAPAVDVEGDPVRYQFRVASGADAKSGVLVSSGWLSTPTWTVPAGTLQDGGTYAFVALTSDGIDANIDPPWNNKLKVNLRLGTSGPSPFDTSGPVTVNLANGNASLNFTSPTVNSVGGAMGLSFAYNSQQSPDLLRGLTGSYFDALTPGQTATTAFDFTGKTPLMVRTDPAVSFQWAQGSPAPAIKNDYFLARWTGFITVPTAGSYTFGTQSADGLRTSIGGTSVLDSWSDVGGTKVWGTVKAMTPSPTAFQTEYYEDSSTASAELWVRLPDGTEKIVPPDWFSTKVQTLPNGWAASTPIAGSGGFYVSARVSESSVVLTDATGSVHTYTKRGTGGYTAPVGEYGVLSLDATGNVVLTTDDGTVYAFTAQGTVASTTSPADALKSASPIVSFRSSSGQADRVSEPLSANAGSNPATYSREV